MDPPRSLRCDEATWRALDTAAARNGVTRSFVMKVLAREYGNGDLHVADVPPAGGPSHSARIDDEAWDALTRRAHEEDTYPTRVLIALAREYIAGRIQLHIHISSSQEPLDSTRGHGS